MRDDQEFLALYHKNVDTVYRISLYYLKNPQDAEDVVQETFLKLMEKPVGFENQNHERGWLILTASNACKNHLSYWYFKKRNPPSFLETIPSKPEETKEMLELVLSLPKRYMIVIYLYYYEGFDSNEIAKIIKKSPSTVRTHLERGRKHLKTLLEQEENDEK